MSDGTAASTMVCDAAGNPVKWGGAGLEKIEILPIEPGGLVRAIFTVAMVGLDMDTEGSGNV